MTTAIRRRRGTTAQHSTFIGLEGETTIDTDKEVVVVHDGTTQGGFPLMRENGSNSALALGSAGTPSLKFTGDTNTGIYSPGADQVAISTGGSGRLFVDASGRVQIGSGFSGDANTLLELFGNGDTSLRVTKQGSGFASLKRQTDGIVLDSAAGNPSLRNIIFTTSDGTTATERLRITSAGLVGVGTSSPGSAVHVVGDVFSTTALRTGSSPSSLSGQLINESDTTKSITLAADPGNIGASTFLGFAVDGSERARIDSSGRLGIGTSSPVDRLHVDGRIAVSTDSSTPTTGEAFFYKSAAGAVMSGFGATIETGSAGSRQARVSINSSGNVGIGTTSPVSILDVTVGGAGARKFLANYDDSLITIKAANASSNPEVLQVVADTIRFNIGTTGSGLEKARIDSSGRLLVGTSSARSNFFNSSSYTPTFQLETTSAITATASIVSSEAGTDGGRFILAHQRSGGLGGNTILNNGDEIGRFAFQGSDGSELVSAAQILAEVDGTPGANDMPGRLVFSVTRDGQASPTEALRISNTGRIDTTSNQDVSGVVIANTNASFASTGLYFTATRAANSVFDLLAGYSSGTSDAEFRARGDGNTFCDGAFTGGGADYAEYFEWFDSNPDAEDRRGISVVLDDDKIREAQADEDPIGVISGNPSVVGDAAWNKWSGKYLRDEFGTYILDANGDRQLNPAYDPDAEYIPREQRPEWDCVGLMGKLRIRKGQATGSRWIKMRDISDSVEEWLVR